MDLIDSQDEKRQLIEDEFSHSQGPVSNDGRVTEGYAATGTPPHPKVAHVGVSQYSLLELCIYVHVHVLYTVVVTCMLTYIDIVLWHA